MSAIVRKFLSNVRGYFNDLILLSTVTGISTITWLGL